MSSLFTDKKKQFIETVLATKVHIPSSPTDEHIKRALAKYEMRIRAVSVFNRPEQNLVFDTELQNDVQSVKDAIASKPAQLKTAERTLRGLDAKIKTALERAKSETALRSQTAIYGPKHKFRVTQCRRYIAKIREIDRPKAQGFETRVNSLEVLPLSPKKAKKAYDALRVVRDEAWNVYSKLDGMPQAEVGNTAFKGARSRAQLCLTDLRDVAPQNEAAAFEKEFTEAVQRVSLDTAKSDTEATALNKKTEKAEGVANTFKIARGACTTKQGPLSEIVEGLKGSVKPEIAQSYMTKWSAIEVLQGLHEYVKAKTEMEDLRTTYDNDAQIKQAAGEKRDWNLVKAKVYENLLKLNKKVVAVLPKNDPELPVAGKLMQQLNKAYDLGQAGDFGGALQGLSACVGWEERVTTLADRAATSADFQPKRLEAQGKFNEVRTRVEGKIKSLEDNSGDGSPFVTKLQQIAGDWDSDRDEAQTEKALETGLTTATAAMEKCELQIDLMLRTRGPGLDDSKEAREERDTAAAFAKALEEVKVLIGELGAYDPSAVGPFDTELKNADDASALETLKGKVQTAVNLKKTAADDLRREALKKAKKVEKEISTRKGHSPDTAAPYFDGLKQRIISATGMLDSPVTEVIRQGILEVDAVKKDIDDAKDDLNTGQLAIGFSAVQLISDDIKNLIKDNDTLKKRLPSVRKDLLSELAAMTRAGFAMPPKTAIRKLEQFKAGRVQEAFRSAVAEQRKHDAMKERGKELKKLIEKNIPSYLTKYTADLKGRIDGALDSAEGSEAFAESQLDIIEAELRVAGKDESFLLAQESRAESDALEKTRREKEWKGRVKVYKGFRDAAGNVTGEIITNKKTKSLLKTLDIQFQQAERFAKNGFYEPAESTLEECQRNAMKIIRNPKGESASSASKLPEVDKAYQAAVAKFLTQVDTLRGNIDKAITGDPTAIEKSKTDALLKQIAALSVAFNPKAFEAKVAIAVDAEKPIAKRRSSRESALADIRSYLDLIKTDAIISQIEFTPFGAVDVAGLKAKLADLNINLMRCI